MSEPTVPSLRRLRDEAKNRKRAGEFATLADAHLAIARERGFASWPRLKDFIDSRALSMTGRAAALVESACSSNLRKARTLLEAEPALASFDMATACITGEVATVARLIARDPQAALRKTAPFDWEPILYACFSRFLRADAVLTPKIIDVVRLLLSAGADPNVYFMDDEYRELPIYAAAGIANNVELTQLLLDAGADPNETYDDPTKIGEALYHAAEFPDVTCARMLIEAGMAPHKVSYCLGRALDFPDPAMAEMFLSLGTRARPEHLAKAVTFGQPISIIRALLDAGAPPEGKPSAEITPLRLAVRWARTDVAELLISRGADAAQVTAEDRTLGAILSGAAVSGSAVSASGSAAPGSVAGASGAVAGASGAAGALPVPADMLDWAVHSGDLAMTQRLLDAGADIEGDGDFSPLRQALWRGHADLVRELIDRGARTTWSDASAVGAAVHGSLHCHDAQAGPTMHTVEEVDHGDYATIFRVLHEIDAPIPAGLNPEDAETAAARYDAPWLLPPRS